MLKSVLQVLLTSAVAAYVTGSEITLQASASAIKPLVSSNLTITCALHDTAPPGPAVGKRAVSWSDDVTTELDNPREISASAPDDENTVTQTPDNVQFVLSMVVSRDGVDVATISEHFPVKQLVPGFTVSGHLTSGAGERGRMTLTWPHPTQADAGTYRCDVTALNSQGHTIGFGESLKIMEQEVSINDLVTKLHTMEIQKEAMQKEQNVMQSKISELTSENTAQNKTLEEMKTSEDQLKVDMNEMQSKITELKSENAAQNKTLDEIKKSENEMKLEIDGLKANNSALSQSLESLRAKARVEPDVFFTAILSSTKSYSQNQVVVYDKVVTNQGSAYNNITGKFTAPVSGFYNFDLHAWARGGDYAYLALRHNGNVVISAYKDGDNWTGTSNSVMIRLSQGDVVDVVCTLGTSSLYYDSPYRISNTLSGRLISVI